jgi:RecB family exonuclease
MATVRLSHMVEPTRDDIDALVGPATPHFAYQLRARIRELVEDLPDDHPIRRYGEEKMELLDRLGHASSLAADGPREPLSRIGWEKIPSSAPVYDSLPKAE